jgi:hypothetical protein
VTTAGASNSEFKNNHGPHERKNITTDQTDQRGRNFTAKSNKLKKEEKEKPRSYAEFFTEKGRKKKNHRPHGQHGLIVSNVSFVGLVIFFV